MLCYRFSVANKHPYIRRLAGRGSSIASESGNGGNVTYAPGGSFGPIHQFGYQLVILHDGAALARVGDDLLQMRPDDVLLLRPGPIVEIRFSESGFSSHSWATLDSKVIERGLRKRLDSCPINARASDRLRNLVSMIPDLDSIFDPDERSSYFLHMAQSLFCEYIHLSHQDGSQEERGYINRAREWIQRNYSASVTVDDFANGVGVSRQYLAKLFRAHSMEAPAAYLWRYRAEKARTLLLETGLTLQEIADSTGFQNAFHFSRKFKSIYGAPPSSLRV